MRKPFITVRLTHGMLGALLVSTCACSGTKWTEVEKDSIRIVTQQEGAVLGYSANSGVRLLTVDGYAFKDLNRNGRLDPYEDWRLTPEERAVDNPDEADFAIVFMTSPNSGTGYDKSDCEKGGNGYMPISLQYNDYTATYARNPSLAGGDPFENFTNRSYKGKSVKTANKQDMLSVLETKAKMKGKPVIVSLEMDKPTIMSEFEGSADAILVNFGVQNQAVLDIISGKAEPSALLPLQMPADMRIVEEQFEDVPRDMKCYTDSEGHLYDFAFCMNWKGVIDYERVTKYK